MKKGLDAFHQASFSQNRRTVGVGRDCWRSSRPNLFNPPMSIRQIAVTVKPNKAKLQASREQFRESKPQPEALRAQYKAYYLFLLEIMQQYRAHGYKIHADCTQSHCPLYTWKWFPGIFSPFHLPRLTSLYFPGFSSSPFLKIEETFSLFLSLGILLGHHDLSEIIDNIIELQNDSVWKGLLKIIQFYHQPALSAHMDASQQVPWTCVCPIFSRCFVTSPYSTSFASACLVGPRSLGLLKAGLTSKN